MKKKLVGILIFLMLLWTTIPIIESSSVKYNIKSTEQKFFGIIYVRGEIENLNEENFNGTIYYNCSIIDVIYTHLIIFLEPFEVSLNRDHLVDFNLPLILPKNSFMGIINEDFIFGIAFVRGA